MRSTSMTRRLCKRVLSGAQVGMLPILAFWALSLAPSDTGIVLSAQAGTTTIWYTTWLGVTKADYKSNKRYAPVASYKGRLAKGKFSYIGDAFMSSGISSKTVLTGTRKWTFRVSPKAKYWFSITKKYKSRKWAKKRIATGAGKTIFKVKKGKIVYMSFM